MMKVWPDMRDVTEEYRARTIASFDVLRCRELMAQTVNLSGGLGAAYAEYIGEMFELLPPDSAIVAADVLLSSWKVGDICAA
jgi:hypothetical protein